METIRDRTILDRFELDSKNSDLSVDTIWTTLERGGFTRSEAVEEKVKELMPLGRSLIQSRALGLLYDIKSVGQTEFQELPTPIRNAEFLCFGLCTAGQTIDARARALCADGELIDSMILDAVAMAGLSQIGDRLGVAIFEWAKKRGYAASRAFSPGAGASGWDLENQTFLFDHLPENPLGIQLTPHFLMQPSKSVSFVIGIGGSVQQAHYPFSCEGCDRLDCEYRYIPASEMVRPVRT